MNQNELYHYGILGMKWGVRRRRSSSNVETAKPKKKTLSEMSDDELRSKLDRLQIQMEKQYKDLVRTLNPKQESKAKTFVKKVLERSGENIATQTATYIMGKSVNKFLEKIYGDPNAVNPKKGQKDK